MASERRGKGKTGKSGNDPMDKVTVLCILTLTAVFGALIVNGRSGGGRKAVPAETSAPVTTTASAATSITTAKPVIVTSTSATTAATSAEATAEISAANTPAPASKLTTKTTVTAQVKTLVLTTAPTTTAATETVPETTVSVTETEPPTTTTTTSATTTAVTTTRKTTTTRYGFPADINKITYEGLIQVPGIGEKTAREILALRERNGVISNMRLLLDIYGIGESTLAGFSTYLYVREADYQPLTSTETSAPETSTDIVTAPPSRQFVNINSADAGEIASKLLISYEKAGAIVRTREMIGGFTAIEELLLVEGLTDGDITNIKDYVLLTDRENDEG